MATQHNPKNTHVVVGMSGGVDSSVSALMLLEQGYQVTGMFMKNWEEDDTEEYCAAAADLADARGVCEKIGIPLHEVNFAYEYWERVFQHFLNEYAAGRTPNPDILCNKEIKFKEFLLQAETLGADYIATGHYVANGITNAIVNDTNTHNAKQLLVKGTDQNKDQSYFLYTLGQKELEKSIFPLGDIEKSEVRERALTAELEVHNKKDSTGICFIGERRFKDFLSEYLKPNPGDIVDPTGKTVGKHDGLMYHTIGQRQGLNIGGPGEAWYVAGKDIDSNQLTVVQGHDHPLLMSNSLIAKDCSWVSGEAPDTTKKYTAKARYRQADQHCSIAFVGDEIHVNYDEPQRAITPGQALVLYDGTSCLGGATIVSAE